MFWKNFWLADELSAAFWLAENAISIASIWKPFEFSFGTQIIPVLIKFLFVSVKYSLRIAKDHKQMIYFLYTSIYLISINRYYNGRTFECLFILK